MSTAISNLISWSERHQARRGHERLENENGEERPPSPSTSENDHPLSSHPDENINDERNTAPEVVSENDEETGETREEALEEEESVIPPSDGGTTVRRRTRVTLGELEEEREMARRRTSACILLAVFVLFRLWIEALAMRDVGLLLLCLAGTSWTARFVRHNREREEELDRRIAAYIEEAQEGTTEVNRSDFQMLSFQAQLALAIMESQRNIIQGGFGHPDGTQVLDEGVSDEAKAHWQNYQHSKPNTSADAKNGGYGSVAQDIEKSSELDDVAHCSICLSDFEEGEKLVRLPCSHIFHQDCVLSWTSNHVRCPLCNFDLESVAGDTVTTASSSLPPDESIV